MSALSRTKGHSFERQIVAEFRSRGWTQACRQIETNPDAILGIDLLHTQPFSIQCKRLASYAPISNIFQIPTLPAQIPLLITKPDASPSIPSIPSITMVVLPLSDFLALVSPSSPGRPVPGDF